MLDITMLLDISVRLTPQVNIIKKKKYKNMGD